MKKYKIESEEIKLCIEQPDFFSQSCDIHIFYVKKIENKALLIVYCEKEEDGDYYVVCADWLLQSMSSEEALKDVEPYLTPEEIQQLGEERKIKSNEYFEKLENVLEKLNQDEEFKKEINEIRKAEN